MKLSVFLETSRGEEDNQERGKILTAWAQKYVSASAVQANKETVTIHTFLCAESLACLDNFTTELNPEDK